jgi:hypothetical protein
LTTAHSSAAFKSRAVSGSCGHASLSGIISGSPS